jgi:hypothetical protein
MLYTLTLTQSCELILEWLRPIVTLVVHLYTCSYISTDIIPECSHIFAALQLSTIPCSPLCSAPLILPDYSINRPFDIHWHPHGWHLVVKCLLYIIGVNPFFDQLAHLTEWYSSFRPFMIHSFLLTHKTNSWQTASHQLWDHWICKYVWPCGEAASWPCLSEKKDVFCYLCWHGRLRQTRGLQDET